MIPEIIIIVLLVGILALLLRHWPETEGVVRQQINVRKPLEEHERSHKRDHVSLWARIGSKAGAAWETVRERFARKPVAPDVNTTLTPLGDVPTLAKHAPHMSTEEKRDVPEADTVDTLMARAEVAQRSGKYHEAEEALVKAAAADPKNPKIYSRLGVVYLEQGENWDEAEEAFKQALRYDAGNGYVHNNLGLVLYNQDKYAAAAREFESAVTADDRIASRHVNLGLAYMSLRQFNKAESAFKRATKLDTSNQEYADLLQEAAAKKRTHRSI